MNRTTMPANKLVRELLDYFRQAFDEAIESNTPLIEMGIVDSIGMVGLLTFLSNRYCIEFFPADLTVGNFQTVESISRLMLGKIGSIHYDKNHH